MSAGVKGFVQDLARLLQDKYDNTLKIKQYGGTEADRAFQSGANFAYYDALDLLAQQLATFGYPTDKRIVPSFGEPFEPGDAHLVDFLWNGSALSIQVAGWMFPNAHEVYEYDRDWLSCTVRVAVDGFSARFPMDLMRTDLVGLRATMQRLLDSLGTETTGQFVQTYDGQLRLTFRLDRRGHVEVEGQVSHPSGPSSSTLSFMLEGDQTFLWPAIAQLDRVLAAFPDRRLDQ